MILRPSQRIYRPPDGPFEVNWASPQADHLIGWFPLVGRRGLLPVENVLLGEHYPSDSANQPSWLTDEELGTIPYYAGNVRHIVRLTEALGEQFTVAATFKPTADDSTSRFIWGSGNFGSSNKLVHIGPRRHNQMVFRFYYNDLDVTSEHLNEWTWLVATYDKNAGSNQQKLYLDGLLRGQRNNSTGFTGNQVHHIAAVYKGDYFQGSLADVRVYNRALPPDEVWQHYDPATRWDLYQPLRQVWAVLGGETIPVPSAPSDLTATATAPDTIALAWTDNSGDENGFRIERSLDGTTWGVLDTAAADATSYDDDTCDANTRYYYRVCAYNAGGDSDYTSTANAKTPPDAATQHEKPLVLVAGQVEQSDGRYLALTDGVPEPDTVAGIAWLYVDQDDGDLKIKFGDGHTATLAVDS